MIKVTGANYYDALPPSQFDVGDIWERLPSFGHLGCDFVSGIVITPACDLANRKVETLTYLPVIGVSDHLTGRAFSVEVLRSLKELINYAGLDGSPFYGLKGVSLPDLQSMEILQMDVDEKLSACKVGKHKAVLERIMIAIRHLISVRQRGGGRKVQEVRDVLGLKGFERIIKDIVRNSYSGDLHFLPADGRVREMSVMADHSVVLFRYAMSVPVELLETAQDSACHDWDAAVKGLMAEFPVVAHSNERPVRVGRLKSAFVPDLISRFTSLHVRMGSPDFTSDTVEDYIQQIGG